LVDVARALTLSALLLVFATAAAALAAAPATPQTVLASVSSTGVQGDRDSVLPALSGDGRFVAFASAAPTLVPRDTNGASDIFLRDLKTGMTKRVTVSSAGKQADHRSSAPSISSNGRFVAFQSKATNLAPDDEDTRMDVFVRDLKRKTTTLVSTGERGAVDAAISGNGRWVAFQWDGIYVRDLKTGRTRRVAAVQAGRAPRGSYEPSISANGRLVAFHSRASNLVAGDTNDRNDVFVRDLKTDVTRRISVSARGTQLNDGDSDRAMISADGRSLVFVSSASDLVSGAGDAPSHVYLRDLRERTTQLISVSSDGEPSDSGSFIPAVSGHGDFVTFLSFGHNLVPGDTNFTLDVFLRDVRKATTTRLTVTNEGVQAIGVSDHPAISEDGRFVGFEASTGLTSDDTNALTDVFVRGPLAP
jgi:Tol biopolymer transport system component